MYGHPNRDGMMAEAPILINSTVKEYYKNPQFYALGHYSKFISPDSVRVSITSSKTQNDFNCVAFERPDNSTVVVVYNLSQKPIDFIINDKSQGSVVTNIGQNTVQSYIYWN